MTTDVWFDEWKRTRPPQLSQSPAISQKEEPVKKVDTYFRPPDLKLETRELSVNLGNYVATPPPVVEQSWRIGELLSRQKNPLDEVFRRKIVNDVAVPSPGVKQSWGPGVSSPRQKNPEEALDEATKRLEEQRQREEELFRRVEHLRQREAELFERLNQLSTWLAVPRLIELPEPPQAIPPWRWVVMPEPIAPHPIIPRPFPIIPPVKLLESETRRKVPA